MREFDSDPLSTALPDVKVQRCQMGQSSASHVLLHVQRSRGLYGLHNMNPIAALALLSGSQAPGMSSIEIQMDSRQISLGENFPRLLYMLLIGSLYFASPHIIANEHLVFALDGPQRPC